MRNIIYLGYIDGLAESLGSDDLISIEKDERIFIKEGVWAFAMEEDLKDLEERYPDINMANESIVEWACYATSDYHINSMENLDFDHLVKHKEFLASVTEKVKGSSKEEVERLDIAKLTIDTVKELIILNLEKHILKLTEEMKSETVL